MCFNLITTSIQLIIRWCIEQANRLYRMCTIPYTGITIIKLSQIETAIRFNQEQKPYVMMQSSYGYLFACVSFYIMPFISHMQKQVVPIPVVSAMSHSNIKIKRQLYLLPPLSTILCLGASIPTISPNSHDFVLNRLLCRVSFNRYQI